MIKSFGFKRKNILRPQQSLDWLKNAGKPRIGVSLSTVHVSTQNVKWERKYKDKQLFYDFALCNFALITHNAPWSVNSSIQRGYEARRFSYNGIGRATRPYSSCPALFPTRPQSYRFLSFAMANTCLSYH